MSKHIEPCDAASPVGPSPLYDTYLCYLDGGHEGEHHDRFHNVKWTS
jgi:hypothetical protein